MLPLLFLLTTSEPTSQPRAIRPAIEARIDFIQDRLDAGTLSAKVWWYGWMIGFGTLTVVQAGGLMLVQAGVLPSSMQPMLMVGGIATMAGTLLTAISGMPAVHAAEKLRTHRKTASAEETLTYAEHLLAEAAAAQAFERSIWNHLLNGAAALAQGLILGLGFKQTTAAIVQSNVSMLITEAKQYSQPIHAIIAQKEYRQFVVVPGGLGVAGTF